MAVGADRWEQWFFFFFCQVYYNLPLHFGSPFPPSEKVTWLKWHVIPSGKLGPELRSCKTQLTRKLLLSTRELSVQAQDPTSCSHPHVTPGCNLLWKQVSDYQQEKVIPDNIYFISAGKTLEYKVKSIDKLLTKKTLHCPQTDLGLSDPTAWGFPAAQGLSLLSEDTSLHSAVDGCPAPCPDHGCFHRVLCPSWYLAPAVAQRSAMLAVQLARVRLAPAQAEQTHSCLCSSLRCPASTRQGAAAEHR